MRTKNIDEYILNTQSLIKSNPITTTISITYTHASKDDNKVKTIVKFKTYDPKHGICHTFKTHKIKEFSKLFNALGPRGCNINGNDIDGLSLSLSNVDKSLIINESTPNPEEPVKGINTNSNTEKSKESSKKKKNKKKGKK